MSVALFRNTVTPMPSIFFKMWCCDDGKTIDVRHTHTHTETQLWRPQVHWQPLASHLMPAESDVVQLAFPDVPL